MGRLAFAAAAFALALLPRLSPLLAGTAFADDFSHLPEGHLQSYRFLDWAELALWRWVFGPSYLVTAAPKIIGALYTAILCVLLRAFFLRFKLPVWPVLLVPLHPLWSVFIAWHVCAVYPLSLALIVGGYLLLLRDQKALGTILIALGVSGYQVHAGLLPALWFIDRDKRRAAWSSAGVALYLLMTIAAKFAGLATWGDRGLSLANLQLRAPIDNLAVLTQPLLSFYATKEIAWRLWWLPFVLLALASWKRGWMMIAPLLAALVVVPLNVAVTGPRVTAAIWIALLIAIAPLLRHRAVVAIAALVLIPITLADAHNRTIAWRIDQQTRAAMRGEVTYAFGGAAAQFDGRPIVMQNFRPVTPREYSNVVQSPFWFLSNARKVNTLTLSRIDGRNAFASWMYEGNGTRVLIHR